MKKNSNHYLFFLLMSIVFSTPAMNQQAYQARWDKLGFCQNKALLVQDTVTMDVVNTTGFEFCSKKRKLAGILFTSRDPRNPDNEPLYKFSSRLYQNSATVTLTPIPNEGL